MSAFKGNKNPNNPALYSEKDHFQNMVNRTQYPEMIPVYNEARAEYNEKKKRST